MEKILYNDIDDDSLDWLLNNVYKIDIINYDPKYKTVSCCLNNCWNFIIGNKEFIDENGHKFKLNFNTTLENRKYIIINILNKNLPKHNQLSNDFFKKTQMTVHKFFLLYSFTFRYIDIESESKFKYIKHFFRSENCQKLYKDVHNLRSEVNTDHIFAQSILFNYLNQFFKEEIYSYDYLIKIRTIINQCWNFQPLTKTENSKKSVIEKNINKIIKENTYEECINKLTSSNDFVNYFNNVGRSIEVKGERFKAGGLKVFNMIVGFIETIINKKLNLINKNSCNCKVCENSRKESTEIKVQNSFLYHIIKENENHEYIIPDKYQAIFNYYNSELIKYIKNRIDEGKTQPPF